MPASRSLLIVSLKPSPWLRPVIFLLHVLAVLAVALAALPVIVPLLATPAILAHGYWLEKKGALLPLRDFHELRIGHQFCELAGPGSVIRTALPRLHYRSAFLTIIRLQPERGSRPIDLLLWPDSLDAEDDRRLRCYLLAEGSALTN